MTSDSDASTDAPIRVAVWGIGGHAERRLLPALARCPATTIVGLTTRDHERGTRLARAHGCMYWRDAADMLRSDGVDAVLVSTPIACHASQGRAVLDAGKHLWCEKSLTPTAAESLDLVSEARRRSLVLAEGFMFLYDPYFRQLESVTARLGPIVSLTARFFVPPLDRPGFRYSRALGGGALLDAGCYATQAAAVLLGPALEVRHAHVESAPEFEVDTRGEAVLASPTGATALIEWGYLAAYRNELTVCCVDGSIDADRLFSKSVDYEPALAIRDVKGVLSQERVPRNDSFVEMFRLFAAAARNAALRETLSARAEEQAKLLERVRLTAERG